MIETSTNLDWYKGPTLHEALDQISEPKRPSDKPLRLQLQDVGRVETGILKPVIVVTFGPPGLTTEVKNVAVKDLRRGYIASNSEDDPAKEAANFTYQVILMNYHGQIGNIYASVLDYHASHVPVKFAKPFTKIDRQCGKELEKELVMQVLLRLFPPSQWLWRPSLSTYPPLGRFPGRDMHQTVAVGVIKSV
ncbi:hypothetical protein ES319_D10G084200v1 [Gossypium barbadense]|uniref:GTP-eEF1A C-terminal domain-containing protein n=2 Tax=Gossypium TaxID=3633 RepID=A0A5J5PP54_GOSBA|nr:hypothetical protein ES319_D10G084200v1 [Gossypium barbadense]TYG49370.1 hypothetical protein ES288_D10G089200v1 [Gossypium darwinii]